MKVFDILRAFSLNRFVSEKKLPILKTWLNKIPILHDFYPNYDEISFGHL